MSVANWINRLVRRLWSRVSCWHCAAFGARLDCLVERPDGLHDRMMLCPKCAGKPAMELQREVYAPTHNVTHWMPLPDMPNKRS